MNNDINESYKIILNQNQSLQNTIKNISEVYSTDDRKTIYENEKNAGFQTIYNYLLVLYYALIVLLGILFTNTKKKVTLREKIIILCLFILYPFVIDYVENIIFDIFIYIYTFIRGTTYHKNIFL